MFSDAEAQVKEIDLLLNDMAGSLRKVRSVGSSDKKERLKECAAYAQRVKTAKDAVVLELRQLDPEEAAPIKELMKEKMEKFTQLLLEYEHKKNEAVRDDIAAEEDYGGQSPDVNQMDREQLVQYADGTQDKAQEALDRTQQMVGETEIVGTAIVTKMDEQIEQMERLRGGLDDVQYNAQRAKGTVGSIARNAATDICLIVEIVFVVLFGIAALVLIFV
eukprot:GHVU01094668.1.p1 GENE.GHVU01094668.1~~GHVU01094668.1.p1  ORF type:complete len:219 (-),score=47.42 GHVU01094668.1:1111-1767(-)